MKQELESLLSRVEIEDILISPAGLSIYLGGRWHGPDASALAEGPSLERLARGIAETAGVQLGLTQPTVDTWIELLEGHPFRAHVAIPPLVSRGPVLTLRRLPDGGRFRIEDFADPELASQLRARILAGDSALISGRTGSGKTSLLTAFLRELPEHERVLVLEDSPELPLPNRLSTKLLARPDRYGFREGASWDLGHLVFESLRMRPDRIVVGECRGPEARGLAQALRTGHRGVLTTLHAGSPREAVSRFAELAGIARGPGGVETSSLGWQIGIQIDEVSPGQRRIVEVCELS